MNRPSWNAGKRLSEDHRRRISEAMKGKQPSLGRVLSDATKLKISEANSKPRPWAVGRAVADSTREKIANANRGRKASPETVRRLSEAHLGRTPWNKGRACPRPIRIYTEAELAQRRKLSNARALKWHRDNPERGRAIKAGAQVRRRWRKGDGKVPGSFLMKLLREQSGLCRYCTVPLGQDKHLDHKIPLARGGAHSPENVCWACPDCNLRKSTKTEREFLAFMNRSDAPAPIQERTAA